MQEQPANINLVNEALQALAELDGTKSFSYLERRSDPYWEAAIKAQDRLSKLGWTFGIGKWLDDASPELYRDLYVETPAEIDGMWESRTGMHEFQAVLDRWVEAHRQAVTLWKERAASATAS